mmetsp:Transcript_12649/g.42771  ORF Transcript_12649/g.42771 Transcript_12649/m.42771 type:complete len:139 (+) Transcript_12649:98-514(+)
MEDSANLEFGPDFAEAQALLNTEVAIILTQMIDSRRAGSIPTEHMQSVLSHAVRFDYLKADEGKVNALRNASNTQTFDGVHVFEFAQIINLGLDDVDEAKALIPSLRQRIDHGDGSLTDDKLQEVINVCKAERGFDDA